MSASTDQDRIETAAENCEVLRVRLAKYEDAEGRPLQPAADIAKRIDQAITDFTSGRACMHVPPFDTDVDVVLSECLKLANALESQAREIHRLGLMVSEADFNYDQDRAQFERELAALKAQPSAAVPDSVVWIDAHHIQPGNNPSFIRDVALVSAVKTAETQVPLVRLNSSPVSAGGVDERAAFREHLRKCAAEVATWPQWKQEALGRPISDCLRGQFETWAMETNHPVFGYIGSDWLDHGDDPNTYANDYIQGAWVMFQRSAPSHGEQVRGSSEKYFIATQGLNRSTGQWETIRGDFYLADAHPLPAWSDVIAERQRQVSAEGWTPEHDDAHSDGALAKAAACYAANAGDPRIPKTWPWMAKFWKPGTARRMLVKSGALILAEIERIDRAAAPSAGSQGGDA